METKKCSKCGEVKAVEEFYRCSRNVDGRNGVCKTCKGEINRAWFLRNREQAYQAQRKCKAANPDRYKEIERKSKEKNREKAAETQSAYRKANAERIKAVNKKWAAENADKVKDYVRNGRRDLADYYVRKTLGDVEVTPEIIEVKRQQLLVHRELRKFQKLLKEQTK